MKALLLALFIGTITASAHAQTTSSQAADQNLYWLALKASILQMENEWGHIKDSVGEVQTDYRHMIVEHDPIITDALPTQFDGHVVEYLDDAGLTERYRKLGKSYATLRIRPIQNDGATLKIGISVYWVSYRKQGLLFELSDWSDVEFRYDCDKQHFVISSVKLGGI
jgi:hypothetical protein